MDSESHALATLALREGSRTRCASAIGLRAIRACLIAFPSILFAQQSPAPTSFQTTPLPSGNATLTRGLEIDDLAYTVFGRRDGLPDGAIYSITRLSGGDFVIGTSEGAKHFTGRSWAMLPNPPFATELGVRFVLDAPQEGRYFIYDRWVSLEHKGEFIRHFKLGDNQGPIYSAVLFPRRDGHPQLVVGAAAGVFVLEDDGELQPMPMPSGITATDAMVATRTVGTQTELWVGTRGHGVLRLSDGEWTVWNRAHGLANVAVEHIATTPPGDSASAIVATENGSYMLIRNRWHPIGPDGTISRVLRVRIRDTIETWVGTSNGHLYRSRDDRTWKSIVGIPRTVGSRVQMLEAMNHGLSSPSVYVGFRSGVLLRITSGPAATIVSPGFLREHSITAASTITANGSMWFWAMDFGAFSLPDLRAAPSRRIPVVSGDPRARVFVDTTSKPNRLFATYDWRLFEWSGTSWKELINAGERQAIHTIIRGPSPDGHNALLILSMGGAWYESAPSVFTKWPNFPAGSRAAVVDSSAGRATIALGMSDGRVLRMEGTSWKEVFGDLTASAVLSSIGLPIKMQYVKLPSQECLLIVGGARGLGMLRTCNGSGSWHIVNEDHTLGMLGVDIADLKVLPNWRLAIASSRGLVIAQLGERASDSLGVVDSYTDQDGLPNPYVAAIGPLDDRRRLWVGTPLGVGFIRLDSSSLRINGPTLNLVRIRDAAGNKVRTGARIPVANARLELDAFALSYHRDDETVYRFELDGTPITTPGWTTQSSATLPVLTTGSHTLKVRAADYRGMEAPAHEVAFTVLPPPWRSPAALLFYAIAAAGSIAVADKRRNRNAVRRAREAEDNERRIKVSELRFRRLFEDGANPQLLASDGVIMQANRAACVLLQSNAQDMTGRLLSNVLPTALLNDTAAALTAPRNSDATIRGEYELIGADNEPIPVEVWYTRIPLDTNVLDHFELRDLRERNRLEAERRLLEMQLRDSQRLESVGTLAGGVAHDFNNLLTVIHTNAELAASDVPNDSAAAQSLQQLLRASQRARDVVRQILTFSRRTEPKRVKVSVHDLLEETHSLLRSTVPSTVHLVINDRSMDASVNGDPTQLQQLLLNLCSNAEYAMRETQGGTLRVEAEWLAGRSGGKTGQIVLRVSDTGPGISSEVQARMFEPFFTTKPVGEGTGLGLSVLHGIVTSHGGTISVKSEMEAGTVFEVCLPASLSGASDGEESDIVQPVANFAPSRVLLVDDEQAVTHALKRLLERNGFEVVTASNGSEALDMVRFDTTFDLILTDQTMPVMTGIEFAERIRTMGIDTPIILASGFGSIIDSAQISHLTDLHRIDKPFTSKDLLDLIVRAAKRN